MKKEIFLNEHESETLSFFDKMTIQTRKSKSLETFDQFSNGKNHEDDIIDLEIEGGNDPLNITRVSFKRKKMLELAKTMLEFCE